jgi:hypothetical protein
MKQITFFQGGILWLDPPWGLNPEWHSRMLKSCGCGQTLRWSHHTWGRLQAMLSLHYTLEFALQVRKTHRHTSVRVAEKSLANSSGHDSLCRLHHRFTGSLDCCCWGACSEIGWWAKLVAPVYCGTAGWLAGSPLAAFCCKVMWQGPFQSWWDVTTSSPTQKGAQCQSALDRGCCNQSMWFAGPEQMACVLRLKPYRDELIKWWWWWWWCSIEFLPRCMQDWRGPLTRWPDCCTR